VKIEMTARQIELARHALGFPNSRNRSYRNHFCAGPGHDDYADWEDLVSKGLALKRSDGQWGGDSMFYLTLEAALSVRLAKEHISAADPKQMREAANHESRKS
jgi:hypothetical protein